MTSRSSVWVVTLSYPDAGIDMTSMDAREVDDSPAVGAPVDF